MPFLGRVAIHVMTHRDEPLTVVNNVEEVEVMYTMTIEVDITTTEMTTGMAKIAQTMATMDI